MSSPHEQARGKTREGTFPITFEPMFEDAASTTARKQWEEAVAEENAPQIDMPKTAKPKQRPALVSGYLHSEIDYPAAQAPIAPVEDR
jgi:hypothetical protein